MLRVPPERRSSSNERAEVAVVYCLFLMRPSLELVEGSASGRGGGGWGGLIADTAAIKTF